MDAHKKKIVAPIVVTVLMVLYYLVYFGAIATVVTGLLKYALGIAPLIFSAVTIGVCIERIKEIKEGEEVDLSQY